MLPPGGADLCRAAPPCYNPVRRGCRRRLTSELPPGRSGGSGILLPCNNFSVSKFLQGVREQTIGTCAEQEAFPLRMLQISSKPLCRQADGGVRQAA